ncbi:unnamed protein product [Caenorhabditis angaria]|uniref:Uncharacterized protein n=1 Tax=Caenorhabditis angaria TaxID=860376 RepID=A0A9P1IGE2_9PELO|nr:unnamed protein product [Caenorhabditis angaria]
MNKLIIAVLILSLAVISSASNLPIVFQYPTCPAVSSYSNITEVPKLLPASTEFPQEQEQEEDQEIHSKSLYIAKFIAQLIVLLIAVNIVTIEFDEEFELHRAQEVRLIPLNAKPMQVSYERLERSTEC